MAVTQSGIALLSLCDQNLQQPVVVDSAVEVEQCLTHHLDPSAPPLLAAIDRGLCALLRVPLLSSAAFELTVTKIGPPAPLPPAASPHRRCTPQRDLRLGVPPSLDMACTNASNPTHDVIGPSFFDFQLSNSGSLTLSPSHPLTLSPSHLHPLILGLTLSSR